MTETMTKRRMMGELIFQNSDDATAAVEALGKLGFTTRTLGWTDPEGTPTVWVLAFFDDYEDDQHEFFNWIHGLTFEDLGGEVIEAGNAPDDVEAWIASKS